MISMIRTAPAFLILACASAALAQPGQGQMRPGSAPVVTLSVTESVEAAPDMATISTGVETRALTAKDAMAQNAAQMDALVKALIKAGIERKDLHTSAINLNPQYDYSNRQDGEGPRFIGYQASNMLTVTLRKLDKAGETIDAMVAAGATNINGPSFGIEDDSRLVDQARAKAVASAAQRAQFYATAAGYKSASLIEISETGSMQPVPFEPVARQMSAAMPAPKTPFEPGQLSTSITLSFRYMLER